MRTSFLILIFFISTNLIGQENAMDSISYYKQIPDYPENYEPGNVISRMIDGLGYRYYWATEGLGSEDLTYKPSDDAKSTLSTIEHVYSLSKSILNASHNSPNIRPEDDPEMEFDELRLRSLENFRLASENMMGKTAEEIDTCSVIFKRGDTTKSFPYWHMLNGQIADALYHTGQIVSFRRTTGNPMDMNVNVFTGRSRQK